VRQGLRPRADPARDAEIVAAFFPVAQKEPVLDLTGNNRITQALLDERAGLKDAETRASERIREIDTVIKDVLGPHARASLPGWKLSWPTITRKAYEVAASTFRGGVTVTKVEEA
jgi:hypothetical protein